ncbi:heat shock-like protein 15 [Actinobacillus minor NM305]|uniref:Heat shock-like protein 15 n=1 Tax=Actinobacillus minor NM305 TaxID=637911 RepID=C5RZV4_9PAST|nr:heat shock-like protein 15 [Actinobacillus minor NM305]
MLSDQRRGAPEAQLLYHETEKSIQEREKSPLPVKQMRYRCHTPIVAQIKKSDGI